MTTGGQFHRGFGRLCGPWVLLAAVVIAGCHIASPTIFERDQITTVGHVPGAAIDVLTSNGAIKVVKTARDDAEIVAHLKSDSQERLNAAQIVAQRRADNTLEIRVEWPDGEPHHRDGCGFEIQIPDAVGVKLVSDNGEIQIVNLAGPASLQTANGGIQSVHHAGPIDAHTVNGTIEVTAAKDAVDVGTTNGAIRVTLAPDSSGPVEARVVNGAVEVLVGPAFAGDMSAQATNGTVVVDQSVGARRVNNDPHSTQLAFAPAGKQSSVSTVNGAVHVGMIEGAEKPQ